MLSIIQGNHVLYKKEKGKREDERNYRSNSREMEARRIGKREDRARMRPVGGVDDPYPV